MIDSAQILLEALFFLVRKEIERAIKKHEEEMHSGQDATGLHLRAGTDRVAENQPKADELRPEQRTSLRCHNKPHSGLSGRRFGRVL